MEDEKRRQVRSYVLRSGRISGLQRRALDELSDTYIIPFEEKPVDPGNLLGRDQVVIEIGFGMGIATAQIAEENPQTGFIGIEVYPPGVGKLLSEIDRRGLKNLRIIRYDAVEVFRQMVPDQSLQGIHIFFPDPWPKKKHHKRRLIQPEFVRLAAQKLKAGGYIHLATDWVEYAGQMLEILSAEKLLENAYAGYADDTHMRKTTKFETRGLSRMYEIRDIYFLKR